MFTSGIWKGAIGSYNNTIVTMVGNRVYVKAINFDTSKYINASYNVKYNTISINKVILYKEDTYYDTNSFDKLDIYDKNVILAAIGKIYN